MNFKIPDSIYKKIMKLPQLLEVNQVIPQNKTRKALTAILAIAYTGAPWAEIEKDFSLPSQVLFECYSKWSKAGLFRKIPDIVSSSSNKDWIWLQNLPIFLKSIRPRYIRERKGMRPRYRTVNMELRDQQVRNLLVKADEIFNRM